MRRFAALTIPFAMLAPVASAQIAAPNAPRTTTAPAKDRMICKTSDTLGSRLKQTKICHTQSEWRQMSRDQADNMDGRLRTVHQESPGG